MSKHAQVQGKALLAITRLPSRSGGYHWDLHASILSLVHSTRMEREAVLECVLEDFSCAEWNVHPMPDVAYRIATYWRIDVAVVFQCEWGVDYWGEGWGHLQYLKERVLRRRPTIKLPYMGLRKCPNN